ncbi:hypothetical protein [Sphingomonas nostoxanthinifaciens]|uniref:hypothetical protein n=1 Tax=Sphingomonas nostoxanthinifaciens TaxID=2872652 RepID=UPI001CC2101F|nr:hypothetical protein [Sphingomonas nostoxanthinifaciens]UAK23415.1 hypothetical protein K8P63_13550 [Sphingomonas nostoxanthinifaciens]
MIVDTLTIARELKAADLPAGQAEAIAAAIGRSVSETAATKVDLDLLRHELKADIEKVRNQLLLWFVSTQIALGGLMIALIKL